MPIHNVTCDTFPWVEHLIDGDRKRFQKELLQCVAKSVTGGDWAGLEDLIQDWKATAEAERSPEIARSLRDKGRRSEYVTLEWRHEAKIRPLP